ncbi:MAG: type II toxin-antitoxin system HicA family toxin [Aquabacterium sp.]|nr:type II toxin-antitoxin system HicA family toxin [Ferruginibacter sp.]
MHPLYTSREIFCLLEKKGFMFDRASANHQIYILPDDLKRVMVPIHNKDLLKGTFDNILKQAGIDNRIIFCWHN